MAQCNLPNPTCTVSVQRLSAFPFPVADTVSNLRLGPTTGENAKLYYGRRQKLRRVAMAYSLR